MGSSTELMSLDGEGHGSLSIPPAGLDRIVLVVCQALAESYDLDARQWTQGDYRYSIEYDIPPPTISSVEPSSVPRGAHGFAATIRGSGFYNGSELAVKISGNGCAVTAVERKSADELSITLTVAPTAELGPRDVSVTNPGGSAATAPGALSIVEPKRSLQPTNPTPTARLAADAARLEQLAELPEHPLRCSARSPGGCYVAREKGPCSLASQRGSPRARPRHGARERQRSMATWIPPSIRFASTTPIRPVPPWHKKRSATQSKPGTRCSSKWGSRSRRLKPTLELQLRDLDLRRPGIEQPRRGGRRQPQNSAHRLHHAHLDCEHEPIERLDIDCHDGALAQAALLSEDAASVFVWKSSAVALTALALPADALFSSIMLPTFRSSPTRDSVALFRPIRKSSGTTTAPRCSGCSWRARTDKATVRCFAELWRAARQNGTVVSATAGYGMLDAERAGRARRRHRWSAPRCPT
jgi:hypothetical protein